MRQERIQNPVPGRVDFVAGRWLWRCTNCTRLSKWDDDWSWHGSILEAEENKFDWVACSMPCARKLAKKHGTSLKLVKHD